MRVLLIICLYLIANQVECRKYLNCDEQFQQMSSVANVFGVDESDPAYAMRNNSEFDCINYYMKFIESLGYDMTYLMQAYEAELRSHAHSRKALSPANRYLKRFVDRLQK